MGGQANDATYDVMEESVMIINTYDQPKGTVRDTSYFEGGLGKRSSQSGSSLFGQNEASIEYEEIVQKAFRLAKEGKIEELREFG